MAGRRGLFVRRDATAGTSPQDARLALAGLLTPSGDLGVVGGVISGCTVTGMNAWTYSVAAGHLVGTRGASEGAHLFSVDGATTTPTVSAAPASGSRYDLIWARQRDIDLADTDSTVAVGVTSGSSGGSPSKPYGSVPVGAVVVAEARVFAGATQTDDPNVTITHPGPRVAARGGIIPVPNTTVRDALAAAASPSPTQPLYVHRANATNAELALEFTTDGSNWTTAGRVDTGWLIPTLAGTWSSLNALRQVRYRRIGGCIHLRGIATGGGTTTIFTLPVGFRPAQDWRVLQQSGDSGTSSVSVVVNASTGIVAAATGTQPCFDNIIFPADG